METPVYIVCKDEKKINNEMAEKLKESGFKVINYVSFDYTLRNIFHIYKNPLNYLS